MNRFVTTTAIAAVLLIVQACSTSPTTNKQKSTITPQDNHSEANKKHTHSTQQVSPVAEHQHATTEINHNATHSTYGEQHSVSASTRAILTALKPLSINTLIPLVIDIQDSEGKAIASFDIFQEKQMHLIMVSDDLQVFSHLHPIYRKNGRFEVTAQFPQTGGYTLIRVVSQIFFSDKRSVAFAFY